MDDRFNVIDVLWRLVFAMALVLLTFNPTGHSYFHLLADGFPSVRPTEAIAGLALVMAWLFFVRSTLAAIGTLGVALMLAFFASVVWWVVSKGWLDLTDRRAMAWVVLIVVGLVLGVGMSWSHVRRRLSGQAAVDRVDA